MARSKDEVTLLTLNTHSWQEADHAFCLSSVAAFLRREQPDIIALQEVNQAVGSQTVPARRLKDSGFLDTGDPIREDNWALVLAEMVPGYSLAWTYAHIGYGRWEEGVALMSKMPVTEVRVFDLSAPNVRLRRKALGVRTESGWFFSVHMGWWDDPEDSFANQWRRLNDDVRSLKEASWRLGDFNAPAHIRGEGYDRMLADGWQDCYARAEKRDSGITVPHQIDGWRKRQVDGFRLDYCLAGQPGRTIESRVVFDGLEDPAVSDHFGVLTREIIA